MYLGSFHLIRAPLRAPLGKVRGIGKKEEEKKKI